MNLGKVPLISKEECEDYVDIVSAHGVWVDGVSPSTTYKKEVKHNRECFQDSKVNQPPVVRGVLEILQKAIVLFALVSTSTRMVNFTECIQTLRSWATTPSIAPMYP
jgi:hypothetical protein